MKVGSNPSRCGWSKVIFGMRITALLRLAAGLSLAATLDGSPIALRCGRLLQSGNLIDNAVILTTGGKIEGVGPGLAIPSGAQIIQLPEATCLPGSIDLQRNRVFQALGISVPRSTVTGVKRARQTLADGNLGLDAFAQWIGVNSHKMTMAHDETRDDVARISGGLR
jgi:hypothetical protein